MKLLVIGCNGQLGTDMMRVASGGGFPADGIDFPAIDIAKPDSIEAAVARFRPDVIVNCAAHTAVDACETEVEKAFALNQGGVRNIAAAARRVGAAVAHISTDYVFDGSKKTAYVETDAPNPASVYGKSKLAGEMELAEACDRYWIFRIAWLYGTSGSNFVKTIRGVAQKRAAAREPLKVVNDQKGTPTYTAHVCRQVLSIVKTAHYGLFHCTNEGQCTWFEFARHIVRAYGIPVDVVPCTTAEFPRPALRPANSVLENERLKKLGLNIMPHWEQGFEEFLMEEIGGGG
jgi:dTDP-4-dehydrorhamnose reductase